MAQKPPQENPSRGAVRRLIAAGASPQRANQFAQQAMAKAVPAPAPKNTVIRGAAPRIVQPVMPEVAPMAMPEMAPAMMPEVAPAVMPEVAPQVMPEVASEGTVSAMSAPQIGKPQGYNEWYNDKLGAFSLTQVPFQYRPPKVTDKGFNQYYDLILGKGSYANAFNNVVGQISDLATKAPNINGVIQGQISTSDKLNADKWASTVFNYIVNGVDEQTLLQQVAAQKKPQDSKQYKTTEKQLGLVRTMYAEYKQNLANPLQTYLKSTANEDMDYKYSLPSQKLKWGATTDLKNGTVAYNQSEIYQAIAKLNPKASPTKLNQAVADYMTKNNWTPWREETKRRDTLKGRTLP